MTLAIGYILVLFGVALILFATEALPVDVIALLVVLALVVPAAFGVEILSPADAVRSFGDEAAILLISLFMLTGGLVRTGVVADFGRRLYSAGAAQPDFLIQAVLWLVALMSALMSNTVTTAVFLPVMLALTRRLDISPSKVLMPLAFASILGGSSTLVGTSTNLVVSGRLPSYGLAPIGLFELAPVGLPILALGMAYMLFVGKHLIPDRYKAGALTEAYRLRAYLAELVVTPGSRFADLAIREARLGERLDLSVLGVIRGDEQFLAPEPEMVIRSGDLLLVEGNVASIVRVKDLAGLELRPDVTLQDPDLSSDKVRLAEVLVMPGSWLAGHTLNESAFRERAGMTVIAVNHRGGVRRNKLSRMRLSAGDVLVVQGSQDAVRRLALDEQNFVVLGDLSTRVPKPGRGVYAVAIIAGALVLGGSGLLPFLTAFLAGVVAMFLAGCLTPEEGYRSVNWDLIVLVGAMIAFGEAMEQTGAARYVAGVIVTATSGAGPYVLVTVFFFLTVLLTQPMSNQASALVVLPIALETAREVGIDPRMLVMTIVFAASCSFLTPLEPASLLVYGPGRYRFRDFVKVGFWLTLIVFAIVLLLVPVVWSPRP